jgi:hypothetical protein
MPRLLLLCPLLVLSCARNLGGPPVDDLTGLTVPLVRTPGVQLAIAGWVGDTEAEVLLDTASSITITTEGCFLARAELMRREVSQATPEGGREQLPTAWLSGLRLGRLTYKPIEVGLVRGTRCAVALGAYVLGPYALEVDVTRREVKFAAPRKKSEYAQLAASRWQGAEAVVLELSKEPRHDWPLVAVRLTRGGQSLTVPFVVSTREPVSVLSEAAAAENGFLPLSDKVFGFDLLELSPGVAVREALLRGKSWKGEVARGLLGADVLGRFHFVLDVAAGVLVLHRPRVVASADRVQCQLEGNLDEESCFQIDLQKVKGGFSTSVGVWKALPQGGTLHLDLIGPNGERQTGNCALGFAFSPTDRGATTQHDWPWPRLTAKVPACAEALKGAVKLEPGLFEEAPLAECPGNCAFALDTHSRRLTCECAADPFGQSPVLVQALRQGVGLPGGKVGPPPREVEPDDPPGP